MAQTNGTDNILIFVYDESGNIEAIKYNGEKYYLIRNLQGDVVELRDKTGSLVAKYYYNAFGYLLSVRDQYTAEITDMTHIAHINPIRYRGYYYDTDVKWYYLHSRYYNPELCRFISSDALLLTTSPLGLNLFAYCANDPVNYVDPYGYCYDRSTCESLCGEEPASYCECSGHLYCIFRMDDDHIENQKEEDPDVGGLPFQINPPSSKVTYVGNSPSSSGGGGSAGNSTSTAITPYFPPDDGFIGPVNRITLMPGTELQRTGSTSSPFVAPYGTPTERLSLPYYQIGKPTIRLEVQKPIDALGGIAAPWFGQIGGGTQYKLYVDLQYYLDIGEIIEVKK